MSAQLIVLLSPTELKLLCRKLEEIVKNINQKSHHGMIRRFAEGKRDQGDIAALGGAMSDLVSNLQVRSASNSQNRR